MATTPIKLKRSHTQAVIPDTSDLIAGEVALNTVDKKFYVRDDSNAVVTLSNHYGTDFDTNVVTFKVTVASKTSAHTYNGTGSGNGYKINGVFAPYLKLIPRITYRFDQSDSSNSGHPLRFYLDAAKATQYTTGVTVANGSSGPGSSGAYTQIVIGDSTPPVLFYQCSAHGYMGWALTTSTRNLTNFSTDNLSEGSSNLYFTNARVDSRLSSGNITSNIVTTGKILYSNLYSAEGDLPSASTYHGMFAHVHSEGKGYFSHAGAWLELINKDTNGVLGFTGALKEQVKITAGKLSDNTTISLEDGMVHYFTTTETTTSTPNIRFSGSVSLDSAMAVGETISVTIVTTAASAAYSADLNIDGNGVTENWVGGSAPSDGGSSGVDIYSYNIIKTGSATFTVIANLTKTS